MRPGFGSLIAVTIVSAVPFGHASAQVPNEKIGQLDACASSWAQADRNGDGWLDKDEIEAASRLLPNSIQSPASISQRQFMDACVRQLQGRDED